uniref:C-type lectin domain-containing protein n=1 Tax=Pundamilia nyererei TaxID=303518 RepID=A0A3B4ETR0_9CICH
MSHLCGQNKKTNQLLDSLYVCQQAGFIVLITASCPGGWTQYGNRCFLYNHDQMTWAQAQVKRICRNMNANLASVHSYDEYQFIRGVISRATHESGLTWIGGSDGQQV